MIKVKIIMLMGSLMLISCIAANVRQGLSIYCSSKAALATLTECLAEEYNDQKMAFNYLALGAVQTEMLEEAFPEYRAPLSANEISEFIVHFSLHGHNYFNGKILPVSMSTP